MKKLFLLFLITIFASFVSASLCCQNGCFPDTQDGYQLKCCSDTGTAYLGCKGSDGKSYCLDDVMGSCLKCAYTSGSYQWTATSCGACKKCSYDSITTPTTSSCVFDTNPQSIQYKCIGGASTCLTEGQESGSYCCRSDGVADAGKPACSPYTSGNTCFYGSTPQCSASTGWQCTAYLQDAAVNYNNCYTKGQIVDNKCYYTDRSTSCTQTGWQCASGSYCVIGSCSDQPDSDSDGTPDVCDTETTPDDCIDNKDNDGDSTCDTNGGNCCKDANGNGVCDAGESSNMPKDAGCAADICNKCTIFTLCNKNKCEGAYKTSTGSGSCYFQGGLITPCCDDSDSDAVCDSKDNCPMAGNQNQLDGDQDGVGDACDLCPSIKQTESVLSADSKKLCTATGEITCSNKCELINVGTPQSKDEFFCDGNIWISKNLCNGCFFSGSSEYYWIDSKDKICDLTTTDPAKRLLETDANKPVCEFLEIGAQDICDKREERGCWDNDATNSPPTNKKCCGDDAASDTWIDSQNKACYGGKFYMDSDDVPDLCELVSSGTQDGCDTHNEVGCWYVNKCCGDDAGESWTYSTNEKIDNILVNAGCYNKAWFIRTNARVTYYEIFT